MTKILEKSNPSVLAQKFRNLQDAVNDEILERSQEIHTATLALLGRKHHFQLGPPGTAKSLQVERLCKRIGGLPKEGYFRWLVTNYTTPEELYGGADFLLLKETGQYKRVTSFKLPRAHVAFLDEIFKGNSSILNSNLTIMNERLFPNLDDDPHVPLISMYAASNELPQGPELLALWDRLHFRHDIKPIQESTSFMQMISKPMVSNPEPLVTLDDIYEAHKLVDAVQIPGDVKEALKDLRADLNHEQIIVTERRWVESLGIIRAEAFFNGREVADIEDMRPLMHVLWSELEHQREVKKRVLELANPVDKKASDEIDKLAELMSEFKDGLRDNDNQKKITALAVEIFQKASKSKATLLLLEEETELTGRKSEYLEIAKKRFVDLAETLSENGLGA